MRPTRNRPRDDFLVGEETAMAQRSESCFEKMCGSPTSENGKESKKVTLEPGKRGERPWASP
jgi:hypothetical protein